MVTNSFTRSLEPFEIEGRLWACPWGAGFLPAPPLSGSAEECGFCYEYLPSRGSTLGGKADVFETSGS